MRSSGLYGISHLQYLERKYTHTQIIRSRLKMHAKKRNSQSTMKGLKSSVHCHAVRGEGTSGRLVLKSAEEVLRPDIVKLGVVLERVDNALPLNGVCALQVEMVGEE